MLLHYACTLFYVPFSLTLYTVRAVANNYWTLPLPGTVDIGVKYLPCVSWSDSQRNLMRWVQLPPSFYRWPKLNTKNKSSSKQLFSAFYGPRTMPQAFHALSHLIFTATPQSKRCDGWGKQHLESQVPQPNRHWDLVWIEVCLHSLSFALIPIGMSFFFFFNRVLILCLHYVSQQTMASHGQESCRSALIPTPPVRYK